MKMKPIFFYLISLKLVEYLGLNVSLEKLGEDRSYCIFLEQKGKLFFPSTLENCLKFASCDA